MNYLKIALQRHKGYVVTHPAGLALFIVICGIIAGYSYHEGSLAAALAYLFAVWLCVLIVDIVVAIRPVKEHVFVVKTPVKRELRVIFGCTLLGLCFFIIRFFTDWNHLQGIVKLSLMPLIIFAFPIALAAIFLFWFRYKFKELGVNFNYWYLPLFLHLAWGGITLLAVPEKSHFADAVSEYGVWGFIFTGILGAALSEEFVRMLFQTRIGFASGNMCTGAFAASFIWSAMHIPVGYSQDPGHFTVVVALVSVVYLMPLGLFWGYITHRTQSLLPVVLMHGFNLWGLQNF